MLNSDASDCSKTTRFPRSSSTYKTSGADLPDTVSLMNPGCSIPLSAGPRADIHSPMTDSWEPPARGALDDTAWPTQLIARVVAPGDDDDRVNSYAALGDLARHYSFTDLLYLGLVGELPSPGASRQFHVAMMAAAPVSVREASVQAGVGGGGGGGPREEARGEGRGEAAAATRREDDPHP